MRTTLAVVQRMLGVELSRVLWRFLSSERTDPLIQRTCSGVHKTLLQPDGSILVEQR
jgi:hypothetical protein